MATRERTIDLTGRPGLPAELEAWVAALRLVPAEATPALRLRRDGMRFHLIRDDLPGAPLPAAPLAPRDGLAFLAAALSSLARLHERGIPHANLKPANLLRAPDGRVVLLDPLPPFHLDLLGIADDDLRRILEYGPPEAAVGFRAGAPGDLYRLGVIAWERLAGFHPFRHADPVMEGRRHLTRELPPLPDELGPLPPPLPALLARLTAHEPIHRFPDAASALAALASGDIPAPPPPPAFFEPPEPPAVAETDEMRRTLVALALAAAFGLLVLARAWLAMP